MTLVPGEACVPSIMKPEFVPIIATENALAEPPDPIVRVPIPFAEAVNVPPVIAVALAAASSHGPGCRGGRCRSGPCARRDPIPVADGCAVTLWRGIGATAAGRTLAPTSAVCAGSAAELKFDGTHLLPELYCSR